jgi:DegV family protein with EDD domain
MKTLLITDSTAYLPDEIINHYGIHVLPLNVHLPERVFKEGQDMSNNEYYQFLKTNRVFPSTSQPSTGEFLAHFEKLRSDDQALVILLSSKLSGTVQSATIARSMLSSPNPPITIIDSMSSAMGLGFQVIRAAEMLEAGKELQEIEQELAAMQETMQVYFIVDNLEYLSRGGRISKLGGFLGNMLKLKPILSLRSGEIVLFDKVRTSGKAIKQMLEELEKHHADLHKINVIHVDALQAAERLRAKIEETYSVPIYLIEAGPVIGTHLGPGMLGIIFY